VLTPPGAVAEAAALLAAGQPVAIPTETVYGLAAPADDGAAVARVYALKGRPAFNPLIVHVPGVAAAEALALFDDRARALAAGFWPGPLTLALPRRPDAAVASLVTAGLPTIALRVPAHPVARAVLAALGRPLAAPSANASGRLSPTRAGHVALPVPVLDGGPCALGLESTIVGLADAGPARLLRPGAIPAEAIEGVLGERLGEAGAGVSAPGQLSQHYAPRQPVRLGATDRRPDEWLIGFGPVAGDATLSTAGDLVEAAARLFDLLHEADASGAATIAVAPVPETGLGAAINDRLRRAAAR
jgi:L-threonylcarbamoyladenylate synthase